VAAIGENLGHICPDRRDVSGKIVSPGLIDLHTHVYWGGTSLGIDAQDFARTSGVTTCIDTGSAGPGNFLGFRKHVIEASETRILVYLHVSFAGIYGFAPRLMVGESHDFRMMAPQEAAKVIEENRDVIVGLKVRASAVITGGWDLVPVKLAKKLGRVLDLPVMVHVGEPPPLYDDIVELLGPGDIVTHCFNGKLGGSILEDEDLYLLVEAAAKRGVILDVGHGGASFSFDVARAALSRGLLPQTISTDLHNRSMDGSVWDMATTMSKLLSLGMRFEDVVTASTINPRKAIRLPHENPLEAGAPAEFTIFELEETGIEVKDSQGATSRLDRTFEPRWAILGAEAVAARRYMPSPESRIHNCPHCGWAL
jgi:dihydroorotase